MDARDATPERVTWAVLVLVGLLFVIAVASFAHTLQDGGPRPDPCGEARASANAVPEREDTVDDEVTRERLDARAERICSGG